MATVYGSLAMTDIAAGTRVDPNIQAARVYCMRDTLEAVALNSIGSKYYFGKIPSNARIINHLSGYGIDDLNASGSPTLDFGFEGVTAQITTDVDALKADVAASTAAAGINVFITDPAKIGKMAWELVSGCSADPGGEFYVVATLADADIDASGTIGVSILYTV